MAFSQFQQSKGQQQELRLFFDKIQTLRSAPKFIPAFIDGVIPENIPEELRNINGVSLNAFVVKTVAFRIARTTFPQLLDQLIENPWKYPKPGIWLEIFKLDEILGQEFDLGDKLYFRAVSPRIQSKTPAHRLPQLVYDRLRNTWPPSNL
jgi:hypothetical protein